MRIKNTIAIIIGTIAIGAALLYASEIMPFSNSKSSVPASAPNAVPAAGTTTVSGSDITSPPPKPEQEIHFKISAIGDCTFGYDYRYSDYFGETLAEQGKDYGYFFRNVKPSLANDDLTIANLECPLTNAADVAEKGDPAKCFYFKGSPEYVNILTSGSVEAVNLANNHSLDYLQEGANETKAVLKASNITYYGYADRPLIEVKGVKIGLIGYNFQGPVLGDGSVDEYKRAMDTDIALLRGDADLVIVSFHWGSEGQYVQDTDQIEMGHYAIDKGADLVIGHHPHVLQPIELYKGRYIIYSLGNFCFGGNRYPPDTDSVIFQQEFVIWKNADRVSVEPSSPILVPVTISSNESYNNFQPTPLPESAFSRVLGKLNWK